MLIHPPDDRIAYYRRLDESRRKLRKSSESLCLCKSRRCRNYCEYSSCCKLWGSLGVPVKPKHRKTIFRVSTAAAFVAFLLQLIVAMGVTKNDTLLTHVAWSRGNFLPPHDNSTRWTIWIGSEHYVVKHGAHAPLIGVDWEEDGACMFPNATAEDKRKAEEYCESCKAQSGPTIWMAILSCIFSLQGIRFNFMRGRACGIYDLNSYKGLGAFHCASVILFNVATITSFWIACVDELDRATRENDFKPGGGLILLLIVMGIKFLNLLVHLVVRSPRGRWDENSERFHQQEENDDGDEGDIAPLP